MLLHLRPTIISSGVLVDLIDLCIEPFGLYLRGGRELMTGRPFPNKRYTVVCRKKGKKAIVGILLQADAPITEFHYIARWLADGIVVTHRVYRSVLDQDFGAASEDMMFWHGMWRGWKNRVPEGLRNAVPQQVQPVMQLVDSSGKTSSTLDIVDFETGWITDRTQIFAMPSIEPDRLSCPEFRERMPALEDAFEARAARRPRLVPANRNPGLRIQ
jgi:hypothetical protein